MTIHKSKGLEFPIIYFVPGVSSGPSRSASYFPRDANTPFSYDNLATYIRSDIHSTHIESVIERETEREADDEIRLTYVAMTRARDYLFLCLHNTQSSTPNHVGVQHLTDALSHLPALVTHVPSDVPTPQQAETDSPSRILISPDKIIEAQSRSCTVSPSALDESHSSSSPFDPHILITQSTIAQRVGTATHNALSIVNFAASADQVSFLARTIAHAEGVAQESARIETYLTRALSYGLVNNVCSYMREVAVSGKIGENFMEGYIDLLVEKDDGFWIIDYKTDRIAQRSDIHDKTQHYIAQLSAYGYLLSESHGLNVAGAALVFLDVSSDGYVSIDNFDEHLHHIGSFPISRQ